MALDTSDKLGDVSVNTDESIELYFTDVYSPGETKGQLEVGKEVKGQATVATVAKKYCFATKSAAQSVPTASGTTITLNTYETNDSGMSVTADHITITAAGQYLVTSAVQYASNSTGIREAFITINGATIFADNYVATATAGITTVLLSTMKTFAVNDDIRVRAYQTSGGNLNVNSGIENTFLSVHQL